MKQNMMWKLEKAMSQALKGIDWNYSPKTCACNMHIFTSL